MPSSLTKLMDRLVANRTTKQANAGLAKQAVPMFRGVRMFPLRKLNEYARAAAQGKVNVIRSGASPFVTPIPGTGRSPRVMSILRPKELQGLTSVRQLAQDSIPRRGDKYFWSGVAHGLDRQVGGFSPIGSNAAVIKIKPGTGHPAFRRAVAHEAFHGAHPLIGSSESLAYLVGGWRGPRKGASVIDRIRAALSEYRRMPKQANDAKRKYSCLMLTLPPGLAAKVKDLADSIADDDLYHAPEGEEDKYGREEDPHITIRFGLHTRDPEDVKDLLVDAGTVTITCGKTTLFTRKDKPYDVVKIDVTSPQLTELNRLMSDNLECTDNYPEYHPHITLAYVKKGKGRRYTNDRRSTEPHVLDLEGEIAESDKLDFSDGAGNHTELTLGALGGRGVAKTRFSANEAINIG